MTKKSKIIPIRFSEQEFNVLEDKAAINNISVSEYVRRRTIQENNSTNLDYSNLSDFEKKVLSMLFRNFKFTCLLAEEAIDYDKMLDTKNKVEDFLAKKGLVSG